MVKIGDQMICLSRDLGSMFVIGQVYVVVKKFPSSLGDDQIALFDNGAITYISRFGAIK